MSDVAGQREPGGTPGGSPPSGVSPGAAPPGPPQSDIPVREGADQPATAGPAAANAPTEEDLRRALADLDNLRKRMARDIDRVRAEERANAARQWLPVADNLDRALEHARSDPGSIVAGVRAIRDQVASILAGLGYPRRDDTGEPFDPARHDAVATSPADDVPPGTVVQVVRPGYGTGPHQLRPAMVVVSKAD